ncbi:MAG: hypothetical protein HY897_06130 [Deltaproteobacteria bacterium]|nr:hypothetical protein [Deltaproteobacteria bacterium]
MKTSLRDGLVTLTALVAAVLGAAWLGCGGGVDEETGGGGDGGDDNDGGVVGGGCTDPDVKCPAGKYCNTDNGKCEPGCEVNEDCASGYCNQATHSCEGGDEDGGVADSGKPDGGKTDAGKPDGGKTDAGGDGGETDGGGGPGSLIIPGTGIDYKTASDEHQFRVNVDDFGTLTGALGAGMPNPDLDWYISWPGPSIDALFVDTNGNKNTDNGDILNRLILVQGFNGATAQGNGLGTAKADWSGEVGAAEYTSPLENGESVDLFFTKGVNIVYDAGGAAKAVTVYRQQKVVPGQDIDWHNMSVLGIKAAIESGSSFSQVQNSLGSPDLVSQSSGKVDTETRSYFGVGLAFVHAKDADSDVNTIAVYPPYFGKLSGTNLMLGSTHSQVKGHFDGVSNERTADMGQGNTLYYYKVKEEEVGSCPFCVTFDVCVGFMYGDDDKLIAILLGYAEQQ